MNIKKKILVTYSENTHGLDIRVKELMRKNDGKYPSVWIADTRNILKRYLMKKQFSKDNVLEFYEQFNNNLLINELASGSTALSYEVEDRFTTVSSSNYKSLVIDTTDESLVYFFSGKDDYSSIFVMENLEDNIIKHFYKAKNLKIFKFNILENELDLEEYNPHFYPRVIIYSKFNQDEKPVISIFNFNDSKEMGPNMEELMLFIKANTKIIY